ncbi:glycosyltransferase [Pedobacter sp. AW31-3R]|uniref:glycosyltransferase n=1 Tax=Pedobacter sp. AW31-3R TaxID=3445781 RepID=UPI003FA17792
MELPFVSIIVPTYNDWDRLSLCLEALSRQSYPLDNMEIIVVNNNPKDSVPDQFIVPGNCRIITEGKSGSYAARNAALALAKGSYIGFTDSDCIPDANWVKNAIDLFKEDSTLQRIGGRIDIFSKVPDIYNSVELYETVFAFQQDLYVKEYGTCVTGNLFTTRKAFDSIGVFNDSLMSGGDFEWGNRATQANVKIIFGANVIVNHPARYRFEELAQKSRRVAGGHYNTHEVKKGFVKFYLSLFKKLIPVGSEIGLIFSKEHLSISQKMKVFYTRYKLQFIYNYTLFKLRRGQSAERF